MKGTLPPRGRVGESGQALVESALTLPLVVFVILGSLQLSLMLQARILAHYAAFRAVRVGAVNGGDCEAMTHAAIAALMPAIRSFANPASGATPGQQLATQFALRKDNAYVPGVDEGRDGAIVWLVRELPAKAALDAYSDDEISAGWDTPGLPYGAGFNRLEIRLIFWFPLRIPFVNWVMSRAYLAHLNIYEYVNETSPYIGVKQANWTSGTSFMPELLVALELAGRVLDAQYVFPIEASYTMRMMTPPRRSRFASQHCPPVPS